MKSSRKRSEKHSKAPIFIIVSVLVILVAGVAAIIYFSKDHGKEYPEKVAALQSLSDQSKFKEVEKTAEEILELKPGKETKTDTLWELSLAESMQGKFDEAVEHAKQFRKIDYSQSYYLMGLICYYRGDYPTALNQFNTAKRLLPDLTKEIDQYIAAIPSQAPSQEPSQVPSK